MFLEDQSHLDFDFLPTRSKVPFGKKKFPTKQLITNIFPVEMKTFNLEGSIYLYYIKTIPEIPSNSAQLLKEATKEMPQEIRKKLGFICGAGEMIWGFNEVDEVESSYSFVSKKGQTAGTEFFIHIYAPQNSKFFNWKEMVLTNEGTNHAQHLIQQFLQRKLQKELNCLGNGFYFHKNKYKDADDCAIYKGYKMTPLLSSNRLFLKIDPTFRVVRHETFLQTLNKAEKIQFFKGKSLTANYGNQKNYIIESISYDMTPKNYKIINDGKEIPCIDYFAEKYGEKITHLDQPLVKCHGYFKQSIIKGQKVRQKIHIYLVPELCTLANVENLPVTTIDSMRLSPSARLADSKKMVNIINKKENLFTLNENPSMIDAMILPRPEISLNKDAEVEYRGDMMVIGNKTKLFEAGKIGQILYVYPENLKFMIERVDDQIVEIGQNFGTHFTNDYNVTVIKKWQSHKIDEWKKQIRKELQRNPDYDIIVVIMDKHNCKFKHQLKRMITEDYEILSQFLNADNLNRKSANFKSIMSKVTIQILSKIGNKIWEIPLEKILPTRYSPATCGLSVTKEKGGHYHFKLCGSVDPSLSKYYGMNMKTNGIKEEKIEGLAKLFGLWFNEIANQNKKYSNLLVIYRDGLTIEQVLIQARDEIVALKTAVAKIKDYKPEIIFVVACNKENTRFYEKKGNATLNCDAGTVYIDNNFNDNAYEFYMQSHSVYRACAHPVFYRVILNESQLTQKDLIAFTHAQCFNYFNWTGAGKVPGCLQYNKKLTRFLSDTGVNLKKVENLVSVPHYL